VTGAVACLVAAGEGPTARARIGPVSIRRGGDPRGIALAGHQALLPLLRASPPAEVISCSAPDFFASVSLEV
jgi:hypothetical protein